MTELARSFDIAMISDAAATAMLIIATVVGSRAGIVLSIYNLRLAILRLPFSFPCLA